MFGIRFERNVDTQIDIAKSNVNIIHADKNSFLIENLREIRFPFENSEFDLLQDIEPKSFHFEVWKQWAFSTDFCIFFLTMSVLADICEITLCLTLSQA